MSSDKPQAPKGAISVKIHIDDDMAQGAYSNLVMLNHTETEFVFDFIYVQPQQPKATVRSRIICAPQHAKQLLKALGENVQMYEKKFGAIQPPTQRGDGPKIVH